MPTSQIPRSALPSLRRFLILALALVAFAAVPANPVRGATNAADAETRLLGWINAARVERGLAPLVRWSNLAGVAGRRAAWMAETNTMSHSGAGNLVTQMASEGVTWYGYGETIGYVGGGLSADAATSLFHGWETSPPHWDLLMSGRFNYVGIGLAHRPADDRTFGSVVLTESVDHSGARAWLRSASRAGDDLRWSWSGADRRLQTHLAGLRDFDVQYRVDGGAWRTLRNDTTATSLTLRDRAKGHMYSLRVRAADRRGTVGAWTNTSRIWVP